MKLIPFFIISILIPFFGVSQCSCPKNTTVIIVYTSPQVQPTSNPIVYQENSIVPSQEIPAEINQDESKETKSDKNLDKAYKFLTVIEKGVDVAGKIVDVYKNAKEPSTQSNLQVQQYNSQQNAQPIQQHQYAISY